MKVKFEKLSKALSSFSINISHCFSRLLVGLIHQKCIILVVRGWVEGGVGGEVLELDSGEGCTTFISLNCALCNSEFYGEQTSVT